MSHLLAAAAIFLFTLYLVLVRPRNLSTGTAALIGALLALLAGVIRLSDIEVVAGIVWDATFALIAIVVISTVLDQAGLFRWAALQIARRAGGNGRAIFVAVTLLGAAVATLFTNDATVLILTPIVFEMLSALGFDQRMMLPYMIACGFVADTMSVPLAVSNLTNMITTRYFAFGFGRFAVLMAIPALVCLAATLMVLQGYYRREVPAAYDQGRVDEPASAIRDPFLFRVGIGVLAAMLAAFFLNSLVLRVPVSLVMAAGAAVLLLATARNKVVRPVQVLRQAPWQVILFALGMYLVIYGLGNAGLTRLAASWLHHLTTVSSGAAIMGTGVMVALFSSLMNNLPGVMLGSMAVAVSGATGSLHDGMVLANVIGSDIGPKLTPIGSLATLIWLHYLQGKGMKISWQYYLKVGLVITPPVLLATLGALWISVRIFG